MGEEPWRDRREGSEGVCWHLVERTEWMGGRSEEWMGWKGCSVGSGEAT